MDMLISTLGPDDAASLRHVGLIAPESDGEKAAVLFRVTAEALVVSVVCGSGFYSKDLSAADLENVRTLSGIESDSPSLAAADTAAALRKMPILKRTGDGSLTVRSTSPNLVPNRSNKLISSSPSSTRSRACPSRARTSFAAP